MLQLENLTPFSATVSSFPDPEGVDTLYPIIQGSFNIGDQWSLVSPQPEVQLEDVYLGEPGLSSLLVPSSVHTGKTATDILMIGNACVPGGKSLARTQVSLSLGEIQKRLMVTGDRFWQNGVASAPEAFSSMPLVYERAFGGFNESESGVKAIEENPIGVGYAGERSSLEMDGEPLPNIEYPEQLVSALDDKPAPAGFGAILPHWLPRRQYAGTYDEQWQLTRAPYLPTDFDARFCNCAPADQIYPGFIQGGEPLCIEGMHPQGTIKAILPKVNIRCVISIAGEEVVCPVVLETLLLNPNELSATFSWKAAYRCDKSLHKIQKIKLSLLR